MLVAETEEELLIIELNVKNDFRTDATWSQFKLL